MDQNKESKGKPWMMLIPIVCCVIICAASGLYIHKKDQDYKKKIANMEVEISKLDASTYDLQKEVVKKKNDVLMEIDGVDRERVENDSKKAETVFEKMFSWSNFEEYDAHRNALLENSGIKESMQVMTMFMPKIVPMLETEVTDIDGNVVDVIPAASEIDIYGLNSEYVGSTIWLTGAEEDAYTYFAEITTSSQNKDGYSGKSKAAVEFVMNADGAIVWMSGYPVS